MTGFQAKLAFVLMSAHVSMGLNSYAAGDDNFLPMLQQTEFEALISAGNRTDLLLNMLKKQIDDLIQSFMDVILVVSENGSDSDVVLFYRQLWRIVENPIGFFVVNEVIKQAKKFEPLELSILKDEAELKECQEDLQSYMQAICKKYSIQQDKDKLKNIYNNATPKERNVLMLMQKECSEAERILSYKKQFKEKRYLLQVNALSVGDLSLLEALVKLGKMSFSRSTRFDQTGQITFTASENVKCTYGWSDEHNSFVLNECPSEFLFFHELLHFAHSLIDPSLYIKFIRTGITNQSFLEYCLDFPGATSIIQDNRVEDYKNIAKVFSLSGPQSDIPYSSVFKTDSSLTTIARSSSTNDASEKQESNDEVDKKSLSNDSFLPTIDPEELFTIIGPDKQKLSPIYTVSENSFRLLHNYLKGSTYPLRFGHQG